MQNAIQQAVNTGTSSPQIKPVQPIPFTPRGRATISRPEPARKDPLVDKMGNPLRGVGQERQAFTGVSRLGRPLSNKLAGGKATASVTSVPGRKSSLNKQVIVPNPTPPKTTADDRVYAGGGSPIEGVSGHDYLNNPRFRPLHRARQGIIRPEPVKQKRDNPIAKDFLVQVRGNGRSSGGNEDNESYGGKGWSASIHTK